MDIREGIRDALRQYHNLEMAKLPEDKTDYLYVVEETLVNRLKSNNIVQKVEGELPENVRRNILGKNDDYFIGYRQAVEDLTKDGRISRIKELE